MHGRCTYFRHPACLLFVAVLIGGCGDGNGAASNQVDTAGQNDSQAGCTTDSECQSPLVCDQNNGLCVHCIPNSTRCEQNVLVTCNAAGDAFLPTSDCDDGNPCTTGDGCTDGACNTPIPTTCNDGDECTTDQCSGADGTCLHIPNGSPGCCGTDTDCDDGLECTTDTCETTTGSCTNTGGPCTQMIAEWGKKGEDVGEIKDPRGIVVLSSGEVLILDAFTNRISVFSPQGEFLRLFGETSTGPGALNHPSGMAAFADDRVVVGDAANNRVVVFQKDGTFERALDGKPGDGTALDSPTAIAVDLDGESIWVSDTNHNLIVKLAMDDTILASLGGKGDSPGKFRSPRGIWAREPGKLIVSDSKLNRVTILDSSTGEPIGLFGEEGALPGQLYLPSELFVTTAGDLGVADTGNGRIQFFQMCLPVCAEGSECGDNGCGGQCGECAGTDATCDQGQCAGPMLGGVGCIAQTEEIPLCDDCPCEECVCGLDDYCCTTAWDDLCVGACVTGCGAICALGEPDLTPSFSVQSSIGELTSPYAVYITPTGVLWVTDNISGKVRAYKVVP
ncbi:MAG: hypothetical protein HUU55_11090 [Myxococcales bacterium]|nr:hypothetical protein [Myxococcales bacterium]